MCVYAKQSCYSVIKGSNAIFRFLRERQKLVEVVCQLNLDSKCSVETGMQSMAEQPEKLVMPTIVSAGCVQVHWLFQ